MGTYNYFDHFLVPEGISFGTNMINHGYSPYTWRGENIAGAYDTAPVVLQAWKNSASHNQNMLSANWLVVDIGRVYVAGSTYGWYWTTDFDSGDQHAAATTDEHPRTTTHVHSGWRSQRGRSRNAAQDRTQRPDQWLVKVRLRL
jgi:hypothetical protein